MTSGSEAPRLRRAFRLAALIAAAVGVVVGVAAIILFVVLDDGEGEAERVARAADSVNTAVEEGDFESLHVLIASEVQESSSPSDLQARFTEAAATEGIIVSVERVSEPVVEDGTAVVETEVTYEKDGQTTIKAFYDLYVLENGEWRLVYSQPKEEARPAATPTTSE